MSDAPERISASWVILSKDLSQRSTLNQCGPETQYVRADLFDAQARRIEELEGELARTNSLLFASVTALSKGTEGE